MGEMKPIVFRGESREALRSFPESARRRAGHQLEMVQLGRDPDDWKPRFGSETSVESFAFCM
jgi:phage-related protein